MSFIIQAVFLWLLTFTSMSFDSSVTHEDAAIQDTISLFNYFFDRPGKPVLKLDTNLGRLVNKKMKEEEQPGVISFIGPDDSELSLPMQIRARGNIRKQVCYYPPIRINLKKTDLANAGFKKFDKLKFVLQCRDNKTGEAYLEKEFLIYELYASIDSHHVRTKMVELQFWEGEDLKKTLDGFLVEEEEHFAKRLNGTVLEKGNIMSASLQRDHYLKMVFFQHMIANTDWTIPNKHNVEIVKLPQYPRVLAIPYDFDYAGLVGASYAIPHTSLPIANIKQRYFMGFQVTEQEAKATCDYFLSIKDQFLSIVDNASYLDDRDRDDAKKFIEDFYKNFESDKKIVKTYVTKKK